MQHRSSAAAAACTGALACLAVPAGAQAQGGPPPPPKATDGGKVEVLARGIPTPTSFAFLRGTTFVASGPDVSGKAKGGLFVVRRGQAKRLAGSPASAFGLATRGGRLYVSAGRRLIVLRGWDGRRFRHRAVHTVGPAGFPGLNGLAFGPDGRLYSGVTLDQAEDHTASKHPLGNSVMSMRPDGSGLRVVATGLRQPWQLAFGPGKRSPYVTVLGQENLAEGQPPDYVVQAAPGSKFGFPACTWSVVADCASYDEPT
jgi:glucose/arabinose dehydrogenase